jgi:hypothetical protein
MTGVGTPAVGVGEGVGVKKNGVGTGVGSLDPWKTSGPIRLSTKLTMIMILKIVVKILALRLLRRLDEDRLTLSSCHPVASVELYHGL